MLEPLHSSWRIARDEAANDFPTPRLMVWNKSTLWNKLLSTLSCISTFVKTASSSQGSSAPAVVKNVAVSDLSATCPPYRNRNTTVDPICQTTSATTLQNAIVRRLEEINIARLSNYNCDANGKPNYLKKTATHPFNRKDTHLRSQSQDVQLSRSGKCQCSQSLTLLPLARSCSSCWGWHWLPRKHATSCNGKAAGLSINHPKPKLQLRWKKS